MGRLITDHLEPRSSRCDRRPAAHVEGDRSHHHLGVGLDEADIADHAQLHAAFEGGEGGLDRSPAPGDQPVVALQSRRQLGMMLVRTAGDPAVIRLTPDRTNLEATGADLCYVLVEAIDASGTVCPLANNDIQFNIAGPGEIIGVGNGDPLSMEPFQSDRCKLFFGKAMLIVRTVPDEQGEIRITATGGGLTAGRTKCDVLPPLPYKFTGQPRESGSEPAGGE